MYWFVSVLFIDLLWSILLCFNQFIQKTRSYRRGEQPEQKKHNTNKIVQKHNRNEAAKITSAKIMCTKSVGQK